LEEFLGLDGNTVWIQYDNGLKEEPGMRVFVPFSSSVSENLDAGSLVAHFAYLNKLLGTVHFSQVSGNISSAVIWDLWCYFLMIYCCNSISLVCHIGGSRSVLFLHLDISWQIASIHLYRKIGKGREYEHL